MTFLHGITTGPLCLSVRGPAQGGEGFGRRTRYGLGATGWPYVDVGVASGGPVGKKGGSAR